jgi:predicted ATPase
MNASTISLEPLTSTECEVLASNLLGTTEIGEGIGHLVTQATEGNPLFVEEVLAMLIDDGLLAQRDGRWVRSGDLSKVNAPPSISAPLSARLDRLPPEEHRVLERASIVGKVFFRRSVHAMSSMDPSVVDRHLMSLVRKEFIRPDRSILAGETL